MTYYERSSAVHLDGSQIFTAPQDVLAETEVAARLEADWKCVLHRFGLLSPIDWYSTRDGRMVGVLELKTRSHARATHETVFLNIRKWLGLMLAQTGLGVPALFVVKFTDDIGWCRITDIDASRHRIAGCTRRVKSASDIEPVIEVPVALLKSLVETR